MTSSNSQQQEIQNRLEREHIANRPKHWVRLVTACNSRCVFCLDMDTPRNVVLPVEEIQAELQHGIDMGADKVILSGGEAALHPNFVEIIQFAKDIGYDRVQTVTNGWRYADKNFYEACRDAGLGEMTFSLHGHTAELHDRLTQHPGSFKRLIKSMVRAVRDRKGPIVNVDVVINKQNVAVLDKIVELCISLGIHEFDLLHVIPQSEAFRNREMLFYDVKDHMHTLHKVFKLNRHPGFVIWTNRFPISYLEGLEDLIQDPHKMLDEVNGRRFQVRRYLDMGEPLDCREPERCQHCFIASFCNTMDNVLEAQNLQKVDVWSIDNVQNIPEQLPFGASYLGLQIDDWQEWPSFSERYPLEIRSNKIPIDIVLEDNDPQRIHRWIIDKPEHLVVMGHLLAAGQMLQIELNASIAIAIQDNFDLLRNYKDQVHVRIPFYEKLQQTMEQSLNWGSYFDQFPKGLSISGLPPCLLKGHVVGSQNHTLHSWMFDSETGRLKTKSLAEYHIQHGYFGKSVSCRDCLLNDHCAGLQINLIRQYGLKMLRNVSKNDDPKWVQEVKKVLPIVNQIEQGREIQKVAASLPGFAQPESVPEDPLAIIAREKEARLKAKKAARNNESKE